MAIRGRTYRLVLSMVPIAAAAVLLVACGAGSHPQDASAIQELQVGDSQQMALYTRSTVGSKPVVVVLHGGSTEGPSQLRDFATGLADHGAIALVPEWPAITDLAAFRADPERVLLSQTTSIICALREARSIAPDYGGDPERVTLIATSQAGAVALRVTASPGEKWPEATCLPAVDHRPDALIGLAANYDGHHYRNLAAHDVWERFDPLALAAAGDMPPALIVHGLNDTNVIPQESERLSQLLSDAGHENLLVELEGQHASLTRPQTRPGEQTLDLIEQFLIDGRPGWKNRPVVAVDYDESGCMLTTPNGVTPGRPFDVRLDNHDGDAVWLLVFQVDPDVTLEPDTTSGVGQHFDSHPPFMATVALRVALPGESATAVLVTTRPGDWYVACAAPGPSGMAFEMFTSTRLEAR